MPKPNPEWIGITTSGMLDLQTGSVEEPVEVDEITEEIPIVEVEDVELVVDRLDPDLRSLGSDSFNQEGEG